MSDVIEDEFAVQMDDAVDFLAHYGVKGMKWGVRNAALKTMDKTGFTKLAQKNVQRSLTDGRSAAGNKVGATIGGGNRARRNVAEAKKTAAAGGTLSKKQLKQMHRSWKAEVGGEKAANEIFQDAAKSFGPAVKIINNDPAFKGKDLTKDRKLRRDYDATVSAVFNQHLATASIERTYNKDINRAMIYQFDSNVGMMRASEHKLVVHAEDVGWPDFKAEMDSLGQIISLTKVEDGFLEQSDEVGDFLAHYGVKGMKWGVRRKGGVSTSSSGSVKDAPSDDAQRVNSVHSKVVRNKSLKPLSNKELQDAITRMNLEQQYSRMTGGLEKTRKEKAKQFISELIKDTAMETVKSAGKNHVKDVVEKKTKTGKHDPVAVAKREADLASAKARTRAANAA